MVDRRPDVRLTGPSTTLVAVERCAITGEVTMVVGQMIPIELRPDWCYPCGRDGRSPPSDSSNQPPAQFVTDLSTRTRWAPHAAVPGQPG